MDKKIYIQPQTEVTKAILTQILSASGVTGTGDATIDWGGEDDGTHDPDIKGESWSDIWDN